MIGLPGNPVSALVNGTLFVVPLVEKALGANPRPRATLTAKLTVNVPSQAGREDWIPVKLVPSIDQDQPLRTFFQRRSHFLEKAISFLIWRKRMVYYSFLPMSLELKQGKIAR